MYILSLVRTHKAYRNPLEIKKRVWMKLCLQILEKVSRLMLEKFLFEAYKVKLQSVVRIGKTTVEM